MSRRLGDVFSPLANAAIPTPFTYRISLSQHLLSTESRDGSLKTTLNDLIRFGLVRIVGCCEQSRHGHFRRWQRSQWQLHIASECSQCCLVRVLAPRNWGIIQFHVPFRHTTNVPDTNVTISHSNLNPSTTPATSVLTSTCFLVLTCNCTILFRCSRLGCTICLGAAYFAY